MKSEKLLGIVISVVCIMIGIEGIFFPLHPILKILSAADLIFAGMIIGILLLEDKNERQ